MATQNFYLLGDSPSTAIEIEASHTMELVDLQGLIASYFSIVKPEGRLTHASNTDYSS